MNYHIFKVGYALGALVLFSVSVFGLDHYIEDAERFPGWKGTLPKSFHVDIHDSVEFEDSGKVCWLYICIYTDE